MNKIFKIRGTLKNYEWGKLGLQSTVAQLQKSAFNDFVITDIPYAELWMGTHISGEAQIPSMQGMKLVDFIQNHPDCLGKNIIEYYDATKGLPFLFKVLSVNKPLSIQVHPDKCAAVILHKEFPDHYPDDNHKPEMAIAITDFEALCGFRPLSEIREFMVKIPHLRSLMSKDIFENFIASPTEDNLKLLFTAIMTCSDGSFQSQLSEVVKYFQKNTLNCELCQSVQKIFLEVAAQYPSDIGCFCLFFLNYIKLKPGEAIYLAANEPHAYLFGDCVECMACSDNVVRAGLTPKFKDLKTLCNMLTYKCKPGSENIFPYVNVPEDPFLKIYNPPVNEFVIDVISLPVSCNAYSLRTLDSASILLVMEGAATYKDDNGNNELNRGTVLFISSNSALFIESLQTSMLMFRAHCSK